MGHALCNAPCLVYCFLVPAENVTGVYLFFHIVQHAVVPVGNDCLGHCLELFQVVHHFAAKERFPIVQRRLIDDQLWRTFFQKCSKGNQFSFWLPHFHVYEKCRYLAVCPSLFWANLAYPWLDSGRTFCHSNVLCNRKRQ